MLPAYWRKLLVGLFFTWRSLRQTRESQAQTQENTQRTLELTEQGQITERFTRAIDQLGATDNEGKNKKLSIRLGGIYALERIAWDSPERDYSTVMEVLTAYVRENTPQAPVLSNGSSDEASPSNEATAEADEGAKQPTPSEPRRPTADIQAILDVLRRVQARVPEKYFTSLDLREANLQGALLIDANLIEANLFGAKLQRAILQGALLIDANLIDTNLQRAFLFEANLQRAFLQEANLFGAKLQRAILQEANLFGANLFGALLIDANLQRAKLRGANLQRALLIDASLQEADLQGANLRGAEVTEEQLADTRSLQGTTMPNGQSYEDWIKDK